ncbi:hypothetical protein Tco_0017749 [Tanacetum coccineum]
MIVWQTTEQGVPLQAEQADWLADTDEEIDEQELEAHYSFMAKIQEVLPEESSSTKQPLEQDVTCSYLHSLSDLNAYAELQCLYLHKVKECKCLAQKFSKQTESVNKEVHNKLLKSFAKLENHSISLELALQQCKEQMKNNSVCKENGSNVFRKEREQYHEIHYLKAQIQDKNIAISELKKLIEKCKGKSVETQFDKPSVVRQPNAQRIPKPSVLGKPTPFSNSPEMRSFQTKQSVNKTNVSDGYTWTLFLRSKDETTKVFKDLSHDYSTQSSQAQVIVSRLTEAQSSEQDNSMLKFKRRMALNIRLPLLEHLNRMALLKDGTTLFVEAARNNALSF